MDWRRADDTTFVWHGSTVVVAWILRAKPPAVNPPS
jgi:hypothetical protein